MWWPCHDKWKFPTSTIVSHRGCSGLFGIHVLELLRDLDINQRGFRGFVDVNNGDYHPSASRLLENSPSATWSSLPGAPQNDPKFGNFHVGKQWFERYTCVKKHPKSRGIGVWNYYPCPLSIVYLAYVWVIVCVNAWSMPFTELHLQNLDMEDNFPVWHSMFHMIYIYICIPKIVWRVCLKRQPMANDMHIPKYIYTNIHCQRIHIFCQT